MAHLIVVNDRTLINLDHVMCVFDSKDSKDDKVVPCVQVHYVGGHIINYFGTAGETILHALQQHAAKVSETPYR